MDAIDRSSTPGGMTTPMPRARANQIGAFQLAALALALSAWLPATASAQAYINTSPNVTVDLSVLDEFQSPLSAGAQRLDPLPTPTPRLEALAAPSRQLVQPRLRAAAGELLPPPAVAPRSRLHTEAALALAPGSNTTAGLPQRRRTALPVVAPPAVPQQRVTTTTLTQPVVPPPPVLPRSPTPASATTRAAATTTVVPPPPVALRPEARVVAAPPPPKPAVSTTAPPRPASTAATTPPPPAPVAAPAQVAAPAPPAPPAVPEVAAATPPPAVRAPAAAPRGTVATAPPPPQQTAALIPDAGPDVQVRVGFESGSAKLLDNTTTPLETLAERLGADAESRVQLLAYAAGTPENSSQARRLSLSRALAVRSFLIEKGVRSTRMDVRALGNKVGDGPADRVDIRLVLP